MPVRATTASSPLPESAADLRALYRAAEARAGRLRVLAEAGQALAAASPEQLDGVVAALAGKAAHLAGFARGQIAATAAAATEASDPGSLVLPLRAPGSAGGEVGALVLEDRRSEANSEDRETLALLGQLIGASLSARAREARLARLLSELLRIQEIERSRIAHELHDGVAQSAAALMRRIELAADGDAADLARASEQARALVSELRRVIAGMRPPALDDLGLVPALHQLAAETEAAGHPVSLDLACDAHQRLAPALETALFRVVQEALTNVRAHAGAGARVVVRLRAGAAGWAVMVCDDGRGFDPAAARRTGTAGGSGGLGLAFMRERIALLGGHLAIASAPGAGCTITAELPAA